MRKSKKRIETERREAVQLASVALAEARSAVEKHTAVVKAISACGEAYWHLRERFDEDLDAAHEHLKECEQTMIDLTKVTP